MTAGGIISVFMLCLLGFAQSQLFGIRGCKDVPTKANFDINQYTGKWYEVLRYHPIWFEFGLKCGTAEYAIKENGNIEVKNTGTQRLTGIRNEPTVGEAVIVNRDDASKLYVSFSEEDTLFGFGTTFRDNGNYWVLDTDYDNFAIVYSCVGFGGMIPGRTEILWILGRTPDLDDSTLTHIYNLLEENDIATKYLVKQEHNCGV